MVKLFIDGQAGTTGLQITERLTGRDEFELLTLSDAERKETSARATRLQEADVAILCLPDDAAKQAVALADGKTRILDASTAHRTDPDWTYGLPELTAENHRQKIAQAQRVSNPGCYPQGFILLVRPLIQAGLLDPAVPLTCHAVSGYSGGGRQMIEAHAQYDAASADQLNTQAYALTLGHKHVPEMHLHSTTQVNPIFAPQVAHYYKGMLVQIPLHVQSLNGSVEAVSEALIQAYHEEVFIDVIVPASDTHTAILEHGYLNPTACNDSNRMELIVFGNSEQILLTARYDNLGKGAAGAAVQNLNLMLGLDEAAGL